MGHAAKFFKMPCEEQWKGKTHFVVTCSPIPLEKLVQVFRVGGGGGGGGGGRGGGGCKD